MIKKIVYSIFLVLIVVCACAYFYMTNEGPSVDDVGKKVVANPEKYDVWDGTVATEFASGSGTVKDPYLISTGAELALFSQIMNEDSTAEYIGACYCLVNSIDLNGMEWEPIGYSTYKTAQKYKDGMYVIEGFYTTGRAFEGVFEGKGCVIKNYKITTAEREMVGFFGDLNGAIVRNVGFCDYSINITHKNDTKLFVGGVAGMSRNNARILGCYTTGSNVVASTTKMAAVGGIVGSNEGNSAVERCFTIGEVYAVIRGGERSAPAYAGGIAAFNEGKIADCYTKGNIYAYGSTQSVYAGGIAAVHGAQISSATVDETMVNCYAWGDIYANGACHVYVGGLAALNYGKMVNGLAAGNLTAIAESGYDAYIGGVVGYASSADAWNCYKFFSQTLNSSGKTVRTCDIGTEINSDEARSSVFQETTLRFGDSWDFTTASYPGLLGLPETVTIEYGNSKAAFLRGADFALGTASRTGYNFLGWKANGSLITDASGKRLDDYTLRSDVLALAEYEVVFYTITYHNTTGATHDNPLVYSIEGVGITLKDASGSQGEFAGWYTDPDFEHPISEIAMGTHGNLDLYAKWEIEE